MKVEFGQFIWDYEKEQINIIKHGIDFFYACKVKDSVMTVCFTIRGNQIRIIGAGF